MKKRLVVLGLVVLAAVVAAIFLGGPGTVPAGQKPLATLSSANLGAFERAFNGNADMPRLVLLLSPT
ncbi:MAG TPA: hypothetical protein VN788_04610 [Verrucomicrobiae bacterium]|nr:hypothetical protein [Verrucomicrobiae bacterium]